jgi:hypothetical protein
MAFLHLLTEDGSDDLFYEACAQRVTGRSFHAESAKVKRGAGVGAVRVAIKYLLRGILRTGPVPDTFFIVALDNDRAPQHPDGARPPGALSAADQRKRNRHDELHESVAAVLGADRSHWPIPGALAIPVEMMEGWVLLMCDPQRPQPLPYFPSADKAAAQQYHGNANPPPQLKDLAHSEATARGKANRHELAIEVAFAHDHVAVAAVSRSYAHFREQLLTW